VRRQMTRYRVVTDSFTSKHFTRAAQTDTVRLLD